MAYKRRRKGDKHPAVELNITAFMNLMVVLVPFLLMTAVFTQMTILELNLPAADSGKQDKNKKPPFELRVTIGSNSLVLSDNRGGVIKRIAAKNGKHDYPRLVQTLKLVKSRFPDKTNATILSAPNTPYDTLVQVMDALRMYRTVQDGEPIYAELFPDISIGDAPQR